MQSIWLKSWPKGVPTIWEKPTETVAQKIFLWAQETPDHTALIYYGRRFSYQELAQWVGRTANALITTGINPGDRVLLFMQNTPQFVFSYLAAHAVGAVVVAANPMFMADELRYELDDSKASVLIAGRELAPVVEKALIGQESIPVIYADFDEFLPDNPVPAVHADMRRNPPEILPQRMLFRQWVASLEPIAPKSLNLDQDLALLQYTSGTTGQPKGAMLLHKNVLANVMGSILWTKVHQESMHIAVLPLFHVTGMVHSFLAPLYAGGTMLLMTRFETPTFVEAIDYYRPTHWVGIATMNIAVTQFPDIQKYHLDSLQACMSGGAPIPIPILEKFHELTGASLIEGYGLSETISQVTVNPMDRPKMGSAGIPVFDVDLRITEIGQFDHELEPGETGEIWVKGPQVMAGYWQRPEATKEVLRADGWFDTGDIGYVDPDGYLFISGRSKELIKVSGFSVFPAEVESLLYKHPDIAEAVVIGVPDAYRGETVKAFVVLKPGSIATGDQIVAWARQEMAAYKAPRVVEIRESLPKNGSGKIMRRLLVDEETARTSG